MNEKKRLVDLMLEDIEKYTGSCFVCEKMGFKCPVNIPETYEPNKSFEIDFTKCDFREQVYKTLTIEH